jgi:Trypsin-co-occurring domain 1
MVDPVEPEIVIAPRRDAGLSSAADEKVAAAATALPALGKALAAPAAAFWRNLTENNAARPSEVEISLGLSFEGGTKWAIGATVGATVDVKMTWN